MSIELRLKPRERWYGFDHFSKILVSHLLPQCPCIVKIKSFSSLLEIPLFYVRMKHIEVNCHYVGDKVMFRVISTLYITSYHQLVDIFMKSVTETSCDTMCTKLDMFDWYAWRDKTMRSSISRGIASKIIPNLPIWWKCIEFKGIMVNTGRIHRELSNFLT